MSIILDDTARAWSIRKTKIPGGTLLKGYWAFALLLLVASGVSTAQTTKEEKIQKLRRALKGGGGAEVEGVGPRRPPPKSEPVDMRLRAFDELKQRESAYSTTGGPSVGVVQTKSIIATDPVYYSGLQVGLTAQPYQARGSVPLVTLGERQLDQNDPTWMFGLEARYMPWMSGLLGEHSVGFRVGSAYARQEIDLRAPTGVRLANSSVHALQAYAFLSQEWAIARSKYWSFNFDLGAMRFDMLLTSSTSLGETSDDIWLGVLRAGPAFRAGDFSFQLNYERRQRMTGGWARLDDNGVNLGVLYGIR